MFAGLAGVRMTDSCSFVPLVTQKNSSGASTASVSASTRTCRFFTSTRMCGSLPRAGAVVGALVGSTVEAGCAPAQAGSISVARTSTIDARVFRMRESLAHADADGAGEPGGGAADCHPDGSLGDLRDLGVATRLHSQIPRSTSG